MTIANLASQIYIKRNGQLLANEVLSNLADLTVEQHNLLPDAFVIRFFDAQLALIEGDGFALLDVVEIGALVENGRPVPLIVGEVTGLEPVFPASGIAEVQVVGYDRSHRLYREQKSRAFLNVRDSELAEQMAAAAGLEAEVEQTEIVYDHLVQHNQSDLAFLQARARRIGFECFVQDKTLYFRRPSSTNRPRVTLRWGEDNLAIFPRLTVTEQVNEVVVRGWDVEKLTPIVGRAENGRLFPQNGLPKNGRDWAAAVGSGQQVIASEPVTSQVEADLMAAARMDELSGAYLEIDGSVFRRPDVQAGCVAELSGIGRRFSGDYLITQAVHQYTLQDGLTTHFAVRGLRAGLLFAPDQTQPTAQWPGVVPAIVTNNKDPRHWGRVKVAFPWLGEEVESDWARVAVSGGDVTAVPLVGEEVLVAFEQGNFNHPFVLGGLRNGQKTLPKAAQSGDPSRVNIWQSPGGHRLLFDDAAGKVTVNTAKGLHITLDDNKRTVTIHSQGDMRLEADGNLELTAKGRVKVQGSRIDLN